MDFNRKQPALLYLEKNGFYFYEEGLTSVLSLGFGENVVRDMDIIDSGTFTTQIKTFIEQYKLVPAMLTIVLSPNVTFEKDVVGLDKENQEEAVKNFFDAVPFEGILTKTYPIENGVKAIACNEDLYLELKSAFSKSGFLVENIVPFQMLGADQALIRNMTADNASQFLRRVAHLRQYSLSYQEKDRTVQVNTTTASNPATTLNGSPKKTNTRLFVMIGVFVILFAILGFMLMTMN